MEGNDYSGVLEPWQTELIVQRARRLGIRGHDLADAQQEIVLDVLAFEFAPSRSNGASLRTVLTSLIDRRLKSFLRSRRRYQQRLERVAPRPEADGADTQDIVMDVREAVAALAPEERAICRELADGKSRRQAADDLRCSWQTLRRGVTRIRERFCAMGLCVTE